ncbi:MAG: ATP-binding protein, partial [Cyclobacteriaceae bacterium]|nr:ATP-binding protein [Cyclobacteriaceae bacterium]
RDYSQFLNSILQNDFTTTFNVNKKEGDRYKFYNSLNLITNKFRELITQKEKDHLFLDLLIQHIQVGVIVFDQNGVVYKSNDSFSSLTGQNAFHSIYNIEKKDKKLAECLKTVKSGEKQMLILDLPSGIRKLTFHATEVKTETRNLKIVSVQDIKIELDKNETLAWHKLIRVLTHEIMNSVSPISSLSSTLLNLADNNTLTKEKQLEGLKAINKRSIGLLNFTQNYRRLTQVPKAELVEVNLVGIINNLKSIFAELGKHQKAIFTYYFSSPEIIIPADTNLLEMVFINLVKNGVEAVEDIEFPIIDIRVNTMLNNKIEVHIQDNGRGINKEEREQVFIPFYTTKKNGSGIGLSLCRQILDQHNAHINLESYSKGGTCVNILFDQKEPNDTN